MEEKKKKKKLSYWKTILAAIVIILVITTVYVSNMTRWMEKLETRLLCQSVFCPGTTGTVRVITLDHDGLKPIKDAKVDISLTTGNKNYRLFTGSTDEEGTLDASFEIPPDTPEGEGELTVRISSSRGKDKITEKVTVGRSYRIYLTSDKPVYQPGQTIHIRALSMISETLTPAGGREATIEVEDAKGNKIYKTMDKKTSDYGIVSTDFVLAREAEPGDYRIRAIAGGSETEITVQVKKYVLPEFKVTFNSDKRFYRPKETVKGEVKADYFFGKPVSGGKVKIELASYDVQFNTFSEVEGLTDEKGNFEFEASLPDYLVGQPLEGGKAMVRFTVEVTDKAEHKEIIDHTLYVSENTIQTTLIPESGEIVPGIDNIIYVVTSYPDGSSAGADVTLLTGGQEEIKLKTSQNGTGEFTLKPEWMGTNIHIEARDGLGNSGNADYTPSSSLAYDSLLLRTDRAVYKEGDTAKIEILSSTSGGSVFVDVVKNHQTRLTQTLSFENSKTGMELPLTHDLLGTLQINAYRLRTDGNFTRDTQTVYVENSKDLSIKVNSDKDTYLPGKDGEVEFEVKDKGGKPVTAALGISVVDESVFALSEREPGLEKVYFTLEKELMEPQYEICKHYISRVQENIVEQKDEQETAKVAFSSLPPDSYGIIVNTFPEKLAKILAIRQKYFYILQSFGFLGLILLILFTPVGLIAMTIYNEHLKRKDENRFLVINNESFMAILIYLAGFFLILLTPFVTGITGALYSEITDMSYDTREKFVIALPVIATLLASLYYTVILRQKSRMDNIQSLNTLKYSFLLVQIFMMGVIIFGLILLSGIFIPWINIEDLFRGSEALAMVTILTPLFMPFIIAFNTFSHIGKPRKGGLWRNLAGCGCMGFLALGLVVLILTLSTNFVKSRGSGDMVMETPSVDTTGGFAQDTLSPAASYLKEEIIYDKSKDDMTIIPESQKTAELPTYLRQYFPETMYFNPELITDEAGRAKVSLQIADSITTWRMGVTASTMKGEIGGTDYPLMVFQDFFIDLDLPLNLIDGDLVHIPVAVYNYLPEKQVIELRAEKADWFDLEGEATKTLTLGANDVSVIYYPVKVKDTGKQKFTVYAKTSKMTDAISKEVTIVPNGKEFRFCENGWLREPVKCSLNIPQNSIPKSYDLWVKIYPAMFSQLVEGLDSMLRMPYGCFEQTTSVTYPNIMVLDYMKTSGQITPDIQMKAEYYINLGYQRLLGFEVSGGGFSLYGNTPASIWLSAYGLMEMNDMNKVYPIDERIIGRTITWLLNNQGADGSWSGGLQETAFTAWAISETKYQGEPLDRAINYIRANTEGTTDLYTLALIANLLVYNEPDSLQTKELLKRLEESKREDKDGMVYWTTEGQTLTYSYGLPASVETTALVTQAFLKGGVYGDTVQKALNYLASSKDSYGTWYSTQATVLSLKTLVMAMTTDLGKESRGSIKILVDGQEAGTVEILPEQSDVIKLLDLKNYARQGNFSVELVPEGDIKCMYQVIYSCYLPWSAVDRAQSEGGPLMISVMYDRSELKRNDLLTSKVTVHNVTPEPCETVIIDLGIPPGFDVVTEDFDNLVGQGIIERYDMTGRQIIVYLTRLEPNSEFSFSYGLRAKFPVKITTPPSEVYEYYNPEKKGYTEPKELNVKI